MLHSTKWMQLMGARGRVSALAALVMAGASPSEAQDVPDMSQSTAFITVYADPQEADPTSTGSGVVITQRGDILTAAHVVERFMELPLAERRKRPLQVRIGGRFSQVSMAEVTQVDNQRDIALIRLRDPNIVKEVAELCIERDPGVGFSFFASGYPTAESSEMVLTSGTVSNSSGSYWQVTAPFNPGMSGGPVYRSDGRVVAIVRAAARTSSTLSFVAPHYFSQGVIRDATGVEFDLCDSAVTVPPQTECNDREVADYRKAVVEENCASIERFLNFYPGESGCREFRDRAEQLRQEWCDPCELDPSAAGCFQPAPAATSAPATSFPYDGSYLGERGYTSANRPKPRTECLDFYSLNFTVRNHRFSFVSDGRTWSGVVDSRGNVTINWGDISPRPTKPTSVSGPIGGATLNNGYCGRGYFRARLQ